MTTLAISIPFISAAAILATGAESWEPLIQLGAIGAVLAWTLTRLEPRLRAMEAEIARASKANMLVLISLADPEAVTPAMKEQAKAIYQDIDEADAKRKLT